MADKFISLSRLNTIADWIKDKLSDKQDTLVSGTNIKTVNNTSLLGSGNIDVEGGGDVFVATWNVTPVQDVIDAWEAKKAVLLYVPTEYKTYVASHIRGYEDGFGNGGVYAYSFDVEGIPDYAFFGFDYNGSTDTYSWSLDFYGYEYLVRDSQLAQYASKTYVDAEDEALQTQLGTLTNLTTDNKTSLVNAINEVYEKSGEPFRVKNWAASWSAGISIDPCTTDKGNTNLNKITFSIDDVEGAAYQ